MAERSEVIARTESGQPRYKADQSTYDEAMEQGVDPAELLEAHQTTAAELDKQVTEALSKETPGPTYGGVQMAHNARGAQSPYGENGKLKTPPMAASSRGSTPNAATPVATELARRTPTGLPMHEEDDFDYYAKTGQKRNS